MTGIANLITALSETDRFDFPPYSDCKTNKLLTDIFGGNCVTYGIICFDVLAPPELHDLILSYADRIKDITNYPVMNTNQTAGLFRQFNKRYDAVIKQLDAVNSFSGKQNEGILAIQ